MYAYVSVCCHQSCASLTTKTNNGLELDAFANHAAQAIFGTAQGHKDCSLDLAACPCVRFHCEGTRRLAVFRLVEVTRFLSEQRKGAKMFSEEAYNWIRAEMTPEITQEYLDAGNTIFWGSVGPRQGLWMPAGYIVAEHTVNNVDCVGVRVGLFHVTDDSAALALYKTELEASGLKSTATHHFLFSRNRTKESNRTIFYCRNNRAKVKQTKRPPTNVMTSLSFCKRALMRMYLLLLRAEQRKHKCFKKVGKMKSWSSIMESQQGMLTMALTLTRRF